MYAQVQTYCILHMHIAPLQYVYCLLHTAQSMPKVRVRNRDSLKFLKFSLEFFKVLKGLPKCIPQRRRNLCLVTGIIGIIVTGIVNNKQTNEFILYFNKQTIKQTNKRVYFIFHVLTRIYFIRMMFGWKRLGRRERWRLIPLVSHN